MTRFPKHSLSGVICLLSYFILIIAIGIPNLQMRKLRTRSPREQVSEVELKSGGPGHACQGSSQCTHGPGRAKQSRSALQWLTHNSHVHRWLLKKAWRDCAEGVTSYPQSHQSTFCTLSCLNFPVSRQTRSWIKVLGISHDVLPQAQGHLQGTAGPSKEKPRQKLRAGIHGPMIRVVMAAH